MLNISSTMATLQHSEMQKERESGILSQDCPDYFIKYGKSYIASSYVKYIESAGARVVPIRIDLSKEEIQDLFKCINGVLFPGGGASLSDSGYLRTGKIIYDLALQAYDSGDRFPVWGTCLGFEMLNILTSGLDDNQMLDTCDEEIRCVPLDCTSDASQSLMFSGPDSDEVKKILMRQNVAFNYHRFCVTTKRFRENTNAKFFKLLSTNKDKNGLEFISTIEGNEYPIFGTQWHPEKLQFEWTSSEPINHSANAIRVGQFMANFFVNQARYNKHKFASTEEEEKALIYQYDAIVTSQESSFQQCYFFE
ncbi:gamma-glutamyl hydrolase-like isoform X2 [Montipora capricornis]|uniref:gamma-glutamyl hydrolase-like isoform X2 n=1 Tax=Montipora foliosa TaxID=591990 RepID=UPI0035F1A1C8